MHNAPGTVAILAETPAELASVADLFAGRDVRLVQRLVQVDLGREVRGASGYNDWADAARDADHVIVTPAVAQVMTRNNLHEAIRGVVYVLGSTGPEPVPATYWGHADDVAADYMITNLDDAANWLRDRVAPVVLPTGVARLS